jgi:hypothetical protein
MGGIEFLKPKERGKDSPISIVVLRLLFTSFDFFGRHDCEEPG